ncbi:hypothetical protein EMMF5_002483 [Cystobasidiomycetes sp. EMM_F5]
MGTGSSGMAPAAIGREKDSTAADSHSECQKSINDAVSGMPYSKGKERAISTVASTLTPAPTSQSDSSHSGDEESSYYSSSDEQNSDYSSSGDEYTEQPSQHPAVVKPREKASRICRVEKSKAASGNATSRVHEGSLLPLASTLRVVGSVARPPTQENLFEGQAMKVMNDNHKLKSWLDMRRELQYSRAGVAQKVLTKRAQDALLPVSMKGSAYCRSFLGRMQNCKNQHDPKECDFCTGEAHRGSLFCRFCKTELQEKGSFSDILCKHLAQGDCLGGQDAALLLMALVDAGSGSDGRKGDRDIVKTIIKHIQKAAKETATIPHAAIFAQELQAALSAMSVSQIPDRQGPSTEKSATPMQNGIHYARAEAINHIEVPLASSSSAPLPSSAKTAVSCQAPLTLSDAVEGRRSSENDSVAAAVNNETLKLSEGLNRQPNCQSSSSVSTLTVKREAINDLPHSGPRPTIADSMIPQVARQQAVQAGARQYRNTEVAANASQQEHPSRTSFIDLTVDEGSEDVKPKIKGMDRFEDLFADAGVHSLSDISIPEDHSDRIAMAQSLRELYPKHFRNGADVALLAVMLQRLRNLSLQN